jgi:hypothetical protein
MKHTTSLSSAPQQRRRFGPGRSRLREVAGNRGRQLFNIWYHYSPRLGRDVVLRSDAEFEHFCFVEGDERVSRYEFEPPAVAVKIDGELHRTQFDALVDFRDGSPSELREIKCDENTLSDRELIQQAAQTKAAEAAGLRYVRLTTADLAEHSQLIKNWHCALGFLAAARNLVVLETSCREVVKLAQQVRCTTIGWIQSQIDPSLHPEYLAATFRCLQDGRLQSNLAYAPLCEASIIAMPGERHE